MEISGIFAVACVADIERSVERYTRLIGRALYGPFLIPEGNIDASISEGGIIYFTIHKEGNYGKYYA